MNAIKFDLKPSAELWTYVDSGKTVRICYTPSDQPPTSTSGVLVFFLYVTFPINQE